MQVWPFKVLRWINDNAYVIDLLAHKGISETFNMSDLFEFRENLPLYPETSSGSSSFEEGENDAASRLVMQKIWRFPFI